MFAIKYRKIFLSIAAVLMGGSLLLILLLPPKVGIDFAGGSLTEVAYSDTVPTEEEVESVVEALDLGGFSIQASLDESGRDSYLIRTRDLSEAERVDVAEAVTSLSDGSEVTRFTSIGPVMGKELRDKAMWAIAGVVLIIILYIAFAFAGIGKPVSSWVYGGITILVLIHDVLVPTALMSILGYLSGVEMDVLFVMALLAVLGYSVNDTIVIFDRVRENLIKNRTERRVKRNEVGVVREEVEYTITKPFDDIVGNAVSQSIARSINTSLTTLLALFALYLIGGDVTETFALVLIAGVLAGTYSSICIASPLLITYSKYKESKNNPNN
ncbi:MAG: protein translocase subunit SecF [Candidatus Nomurabacteria bacterium]|nr:protein translocase subunit SecF [Candidatus Nomurabacteria bacterium]USN88164.1 MAG: protein translocase subunit SecF [Candidatus Nomurabacteria bacterium]